MLELTFSNLRRVFFPIALALTFLVSFSNLVSAQESAAIEYGEIMLGSNYSMFDLGGYRDHYDQVKYVSDVKSAIAVYHLNPNLVRQQLRNIYLSGQRSISLMVYYMDLNGYALTSPYVFGGSIDSRLNRIPDQQRYNLKEISKYIADLGFKNLIVRFSGSGVSSPTTWDSWKEHTYAQNKGFVIDSIAAVEEAIGTRSSIQTMYDLGVELGGMSYEDSHYADPYMRRLLKDFLARFDYRKTYGFSIAYKADRITRNKALMKDVGLNLKYVVLDLYGAAANTSYWWNIAANEEAKEFDTVAREIFYNELQNTPILIQEFFYNDVDAVNKFLHVARSWGLKIQGLFQWPLARAEWHRVYQRRCGNSDFNPAFSEHYPIRTDALRDFAHKAKYQLRADWNSFVPFANNMTCSMPDPNKIDRLSISYDDCGAGSGRTCNVRLISKSEQHTVLIARPTGGGDWTGIACLSPGRQETTFRNFQNGQSTTFEIYPATLYPGYCLPNGRPAEASITATWY